MKQIIGKILIAVGVLHGLATVIGLISGKGSLSQFLGTALFVGVGVFLNRGTKN